MRSSDLNNIIVNHAPNHHSKNPGWEYFPSSQIKCQVEAAQKKELAKPTPPSIKIKTLELKAKYTDKTKPKHIFKKTDLKEIAKKKRDALQNWITEENNLRKGIQKQHKCKPAPSVKEDEPNDQWPEMNEDQQQENNNQNEEQEEAEENYSQQEEQNEQVKSKKIDDEDQEEGQGQEEQGEQDQEEEQQGQQDQEEEQQGQDQQDNQDQQEEQQEKQDEQEEEYQQEDYEQDEQQFNESQGNSKIKSKQSNKIENSQSSNSQKQSQRYSQSNNKSNIQKDVNLEINENKSEVKSIASNSFVKNQSKVINKSVNTSSLFYKSQVADQMRSLMDEFE